MQQISAALSKYQTSLFPDNSKHGITNKRQWLLSLFLEEINLERKFENWKRYKHARKTLKTLTPDEFKQKTEHIAPMTGKALAMRVSHLSEFDLDFFLGQCREYKRNSGSFGKCFFGALKTRCG